MSERRRGPTIWDRIGIALMCGLLGVIWIGGGVFICLMVFHLLPCDWYVKGCP